MDKPIGQSSLADYGFPKSEGRIRRNRRPIKSLCASCGTEKWLNWISGSDYVCDECAKSQRPGQKR